MTHAHEKNTRSTAASGIQARSNSNFMILHQLLQLMERNKQTQQAFSKANKDRRRRRSSERACRWWCDGVARAARVQAQAQRPELGRVRTG
jgi:hypothetical protein